ncbi:(2Fe-2S)-binding protein [Streptomyces flavotricini]|uniref:Bacterioferritin-associated ferredoxin n=1 Tax=Streptomyces flavotricini TaxID=66888 RepID=A0ABS8ECH9_9ACTN|nr:(2Fe-2S)-binding protein [Streptomyces flavotricini]
MAAETIPVREVNRVYVCSCFGITDKQVKDHAAAGACTPRQIASVTKAGTDCGSCVRTIQGILGRGACPRRELLEKGSAAAVLAADPELAEAA